MLKKQTSCFLIFVFSLFLISCFLFFFLSFSFSKDSDSLSGWIWSGNLGWLSLNDINYPGGANYGINIDWNSDDPSLNGITGCAWIGDADPNQILNGRTCSEDVSSCYSTGWLCFDYDLATNNGTELPPNGVIYTINSKNYLAIIDRITNPAKPRIYGWARILSVKNQGGSGWVHLRNALPTEYGVEVNLETKKFSGYAWSEDLGWIRFDTAFSPPSLYRAPWLETIGGNIHSEKDIGKGEKNQFSFEPPENRFNATYLITQTGDLYYFKSKKNWQEKLTKSLGFPKKETDYINKLGKIDINALVTKINGNKNKYGNEVIDLGLTTTLGADSFDKKNAVYYKEGDFEISSGKFDLDGSSTIIIKGDLLISGDTTYEAQSTLTALTNLNSIGILVLKDQTGNKGNIKISSLVKNIVGNFYAEGEISTGKSKDQQLACSGLMIAHEFKFERSYIGLGTDPAEKITYDGRIFANPAPGFLEIAKALPIWKE